MKFCINSERVDKLCPFKGSIEKCSKNPCPKEEKDASVRS